MLQHRKYLLKIVILKKLHISTCKIEFHCHNLNHYRTNTVKCRYKKYLSLAKLYFPFFLMQTAPLQSKSLHFYF